MRDTAKSEINILSNLLKGTPLLKEEDDILNNIHIKIDKSTKKNSCL